MIPPGKDIEITGMGVITPVGIGVSTFGGSLRLGKSNFSRMEVMHKDELFQYPVCKVDGFDLKISVDDLQLEDETIAKAKRLRNISTSTSYAIYCALEAWSDSGLELENTDSSRIAIVSAGSNTQQGSLYLEQEKYHNRLKYMNPNYGLTFMDTDVIGVVSELLGIQGEGYSLGAASASGNLGLIQAYRLITTGEYDMAVVLAPLMDLSIFEFQGFTALGAMAAVSPGSDVQNVCRPFDKGHCGFVYGQIAGCIILESSDHRRRRNKTPHARLAGYGLNLDGRRSPNPTVAGERKAMEGAMKMAKLSAKDIPYVNTHGTASIIGDITEVDAMIGTGLEMVKANSTKSIIGHGLSSAGLVETIACVIQMKEKFLHPTRNLEAPITDKIDWIGGQSIEASIDYAINNSFGFGGVNTSVIVSKAN